MLKILNKAHVRRKIFPKKDMLQLIQNIPKWKMVQLLKNGGSILLTPPIADAELHMGFHFCSAPIIPCS